MSEWFQVAYSIVALVAVIMLLLPGVFLVIGLGVSGLHKLAYQIKDELARIVKMED